MPQWEYEHKILDPEFRGSPVSELNDLGANGWELVSVVLERHNDGSKHFHAFLKRPVPEGTCEL